jgi:hypothetical protein
VGSTEEARPCRRVSCQCRRPRRPDACQTASAQNVAALTEGTLSASRARHLPRRASRQGEPAHPRLRRVPGKETLESWTRGKAGGRALFVCSDRPGTLRGVASPASCGSCTRTSRSTGWRSTPSPLYSRPRASASTR